MKYKIGDTVKLTEWGIENFDDGEYLRDHLLKIEGINLKANIDYPYIVSSFTRCSPRLFLCS